MAVAPPRRDASPPSTSERLHSFFHPLITDFGICLPVCSLAVLTFRNIGSSGYDTYGVVDYNGSSASVAAAADEEYRRIPKTSWCCWRSSTSGSSPTPTPLLCFVEVSCEVCREEAVPSCLALASMLPKSEVYSVYSFCTLVSSSLSLNDD